MSKLRVTPQDVDDAIQHVYYFTAGDAVRGECGADDQQTIHPSLDILTICVIVLNNGFTLMGKSAPVDPDNFNEAIGRAIAYDRAKEQIWQYLGYELKTTLQNGN